MSSSLTLVLFIVFVVLLLGLLGSLLLIRRAQRKKVDGTYFESSQGSIYMEISGTKGPWVLVVHGLGASTYCWRKVIPEINKNHRVIAVDLWGFGNSSKRLRQPMTLDRQVDILKELIDSLRIKKLKVVGHSMGGQIVTWWAMNDPRIEKCVTIAPATYPGLVSTLVSMFSWVANWTPLIVRVSTVRGILAGTIVDNSFITEEMVKHYFKPYKDPDAHLTFAAALEVIKDRRVFDNLEKLETESMMIWGAKDNVILPRFAEEIQKRTPSTIHVTHPECGHLPMEDNHQWVAEQICRFL